MLAKRPEVPQTAAQQQQWWKTILEFVHCTTLQLCPCLRPSTSHLLAVPTCVFMQVLALAYSEPQLLLLKAARLLCNPPQRCYCWYPHLLRACKPTANQQGISKTHTCMLTSPDLTCVFVQVLDLCGLQLELCCHLGLRHLPDQLGKHQRTIEPGTAAAAAAREAAAAVSNLTIRAAADLACWMCHT
jgi:hypothetical protein